MSKKRSTTKSKAKEKQTPNLVPALAIVGLVILAVADLFQVNDVPNFIYFGLIGAILGAKFGDVFNVGSKK